MSEQKNSKMVQQSRNIIKGGSLNILFWVPVFVLAGLLPGLAGTVLRSVATVMLIVFLVVLMVGSLMYMFGSAPADPPAAVLPGQEPAASPDFWWSRCKQYYHEPAWGSATVDGEPEREQSRSSS